MLQLHICKLSSSAAESVLHQLLVTIVVGIVKSTLTAQFYVLKPAMLRASTSGLHVVTTKQVGMLQGKVNK